jgi:hypothetical protein
MSPSESDLRAALRDGEGDDIPVDRLIHVAQTGAARRRTRLLTTAAVVAVLACAGVGGGLLANSGSDGAASTSTPGFAAGGQSADSASGSGNGAPGALARLPAAVQGGQSGGSSAAAACPATAAAAVDAAAKTTATAGTQVFTGRVTRVLVCSYGYPNGVAQLTPPPHPTSLELRGAAADRLVASLERAPTAKPSGMCPLVRGVASPLVMIGIAADGSVAGTASTVLGTPVCNVVVLSAGARRYDWTPPVDLAPMAQQVPQTAIPSHQIRPSPISS